MDGGCQLEQGPVITMDSNIINNKLEAERQVSTLPRRSRNRIKTWKDVSPTKENMSSSCGGSPKGQKNEENSNHLVTWKDLSPTKESPLKEPPSPERKNRKKRRPESGYYSNDVQSDVQESREGIDISLSESEHHRGRCVNGSSPDDGCFNNEYFYDEDFIVQFDTNIRDGSVPRSEGEPEPVLPFPHSLTGSYTRFSNLPDSQQELFLCAYESELSGSRTSMEISSSEREMMCSSDMLDFSSDPLFTPTPTADLPPQHFSVDSLGRSHDGRLAVTCCPRKYEYFLSFNESQSRNTGSESENSYISQSSSQGGASNSCSPSCSSNGEEAEEICSNSFHFCQMKTSDGSQRANRAHRQNIYQRSCSLGAVQERCEEKSESSDLERGHSSRSSSSRSHSCGSLRSTVRSPSCYKLSSHCGTLNSVEDMHYSDDVCNAHRNTSYVTSWKHVKNLKKIGKLENMLDTSRCNSLPDLSHPVQSNTLMRAKRRENLQAMSDSFHNKRHSASLLEMYQRMRSQSNPVSPDTMRTVEQILFSENCLADDRFADHLLSVSRTGLDQDEASEHNPDTCGCGNRGLRLNIPTEVGPGVSHEGSYRSSHTGISPDTVVLWQGTKNFSSQFPPKTQECGIQTSIDGSPVLLDHSMQTSPHSPPKEYVHDDYYERESRKLQKEQVMTPRRCASANEISAKRTKSMPNFKRSSSLSPSRIGKNSFYTHNSLPDLSFLAPQVETAHSSSSLFDPMQIPIILRPVLNESQQTQSRSSCSCQSRRSGESGSSSSCCISSTSSCGFTEPRRCASLAADLERILFLPPHLESVPSPGHDKETLPHRHKDCPRSAVDSKFERYAYETHPGSCPSHPKMRPQRRPLSSSSSSNSGSSLHLEGLYALQEEQSPTSPEKAESGPSWFEQQCFSNIHMRHHTADDFFGYDSQDDDSITIEIFEQYAYGKPLKSCLRKKQSDYRSRSLSNPDSLCGEMKPPMKPSRHSIACDGIFPQLVDEEQFENAQIECIRNFCDEGLPPPELLQETDVDLGEIGVSSSSSSSEDANKANKRVSFASEISFHSPQYSPQCSPKKQGQTGAAPAKVDTEEEMLTLEVTQTGHAEARVKLVQSPVHLTKSAPDKPPRSIQPPRDFTPQAIGRSPSSEFAFEIARKRATMIGLSQAAEALVIHFALARDPFDKLRLGSSAENPEICKLVVSRLCPAVEHVVENGMKAFLTGFHVFGKIHITPWKVAEMSSEIGPYTRAVHELVRQLKLKQNLISNKQKFYAFIIGLLNLRLLDFWMGYVRSKKNIVDRCYSPNAIFSLSSSHLQRGFDDTLLALQPLAVLPFQLEFDIVTSSLPPVAPNIADAMPESKLEYVSMADHLEMQKMDQKLTVSDGNLDTRDQNVRLFSNATFPRARTALYNMTTFKGDNSDKKSLLPPSPTKMPGNSSLSHPGKGIENQQVLDLKQEEKEDIEERPNTVPSPVSSITNLAAKFLLRTQSLDRGYRNGVTEYSFANSKQKQTSLDCLQESGAADRHVVLDGRESMSNSTSQTMMQPKHSPRNSFNIISFFDKLLLPDKMTPKSAASNRNSWSEGQRTGGQEAEPVRHKSLSPQHLQQKPSDPDMAEEQEDSSCGAAKNTTETKEKVGKEKTTDGVSKPDLTDDVNNLGHETLQDDPDCIKNVDGHVLGKDIPDVIQTAEALPSVLSRTVSSSHAPESTRVSSSRCTRTVVDLGQHYPNVDINANSPDFHPDHYAIGVAVPANQSQAASQSECQPTQSAAISPMSLESHQSEEGVRSEERQLLSEDQTQSQPSSDSSADSFHRTAYRYVVTLVSCDPDDNDHMDYETGDYLEVLAHLDADWLYCAKGKSEGLVRISAVQPVTDADMFECLHDNFYR